MKNESLYCWTETTSVYYLKSERKKRHSSRSFFLKKKNISLFLLPDSVLLRKKTETEGFSNDF